MLKERTWGIFRRFFPKHQLESPITGEIPGHGLVAASPNPDILGALERGGLEEVGQVPTYYAGCPRQEKVVRRVAITAGAAVVGGVTLFGVYRLGKRLFERGRKKKP